MHRKAVEMKPEEAIKRLKFETVLMEANHKMSTDVYELCYAMKLAIDALEKQIPQEPVVYMITVEKTREGESREIISEAHCPRCGVNILFPRGCGSKYCDECGQKLDWSEVEE